MLLRNKLFHKCLLQNDQNTKDIESHGDSVHAYDYSPGFFGTSSFRLRMKILVVFTMKHFSLTLVK